MTARLHRGALHSGFKMFAFMAVIGLANAQAALAGEATTSAGVSQIGSIPGTATATAAYNGDGRGHADTITRSGPVTFARGVAYGVDRDGLDFSVSYAVGGGLLPVRARTFNMSIGRDGSVSRSSGAVEAGPSPITAVQAGGFARSQRGGSVSAATASGRSEPFGTVVGRTWSESSRPPRLITRR